MDHNLGLRLKATATCTEPTAHINPASWASKLLSLKSLSC